MSKGLGSMQRAIIDILKVSGPKVDTKKLMFDVGQSRQVAGHDIFIDLSAPAYGPKWCFQPAFVISFYRALNGLEDRKLLVWYRGEGGYSGVVVPTCPLPG